jgi:hypothetical protein
MAATDRLRHAPGILLGTCVLTLSCKAASPDAERLFVVRYGASGIALDEAGEVRRQQRPVPTEPTLTDFSWSGLPAGPRKAALELVPGVRVIDATTLELAPPPTNVSIRKIGVPR